MFPWRDKKERYKRQWEHRCLLSMVRRKLLATVIIAVNPRPSSSSEMSRLEILDTASSSLTGNWLHVLFWQPFSNNCIQMSRPNAGLSFGAIRVFKQRWSTCMGVNSINAALRNPLHRHAVDACSFFSKYPQDPLTWHSLTGPSSTLSWLVSDPLMKSFGRFNRVTESKCVYLGHVLATLA